MDRNKIKKKLFIWSFLFWIFMFTALFQGYLVYFVDTTSTKSKWIGLLAGAIAILAASIKICENSFYNCDNSITGKIVNYFRKGANISFKREIKIFLFICILICYFLYKFVGLSFLISFLLGAVVFFLVRYFSIFVASSSAVKVAKFFEESFNFAFKVAFNSGLAISAISIGIVICAITVLFHIYKDYEILSGFVLGFALATIISSTSNTIIKKSVDFASGFISGYIAQIDNFDRRSPVLLLRGMVKTILNVVSMSSDMTLTFCLIIISSMTIGAFTYNLMGCFLPLIIAASGVFSFIFAAMLTRMNKVQNPVGVLFSLLVKTVILFCAVSFYCIMIWMPDYRGLFYSIAGGALCGLVVCFISSNYIFEKFKPVKNIANSAIAGFLPAFLQSIREGFMSVFIPVLFVAFVIVAAFITSEGLQSPLFGLYGISLSVISMVSIIGVMICNIVFALTLNSCREVAHTYENDEIQKLNQQQTIYIGNISFCILSLTKNYLNAAAILCSFVTLIAYSLVVEIQEIDLLNPFVIFALFVGSSIPFLYVAFVLSGVSGSSKKLVLEAKKQFRSFPQILRFEMRPDYEKCVDVASKNAGIQAVFYNFVVILILFLIAFFLNKEALFAFVFGILLSSVGLIFFSGNCSSVVKSAKRFLRDEYINSNRAQEYAILTQNGQLFSSFRDLTVPVLINLMKFMAVLILAFAPLLK